MALATAGCATTGLAWVHESESGVDLTPPPDDARESSLPVAPPAVAAPSQWAADPPRHPTISLGETTVGGATRGAAFNGPAPGGAPPVVVIVYLPVGGSAGWGGRSITIGSSVASATAMRPGRDWAAPPSYGPAYPYRMAPASPWQGDGAEGSARRSAR